LSSQATTAEQATPLATSQDAGTTRHKYANRRTWVKGQSGNPEGARILKRKGEARAARVAVLQEAILSEFPNANAFETALIVQAAILMERAEVYGADLATKLTATALRIIDKLRAARANRPQPQPKPLSAYRAKP
jgi:hypothetical protein